MPHSPIPSIADARHARNGARRMQASPRDPLVSVRSRYDATHTYHLVDRTHDGKVGTIAYAIFEPADASTPLLVDRGFVAGDARGHTANISAAARRRAATVGAVCAGAPGSGSAPRRQSAGRASRPGRRNRSTSTWAKLPQDRGPPARCENPAARAGTRERFRARMATRTCSLPERHRGYACSSPGSRSPSSSQAVFIGMHWRKEAST